MEEDRIILFISIYSNLILFCVNEGYIGYAFLLLSWWCTYKYLKLSKSK